MASPDGRFLRNLPYGGLRSAPGGIPSQLAAPVLCPEAIRQWIGLNAFTGADTPVQRIDELPEKR